MHRNVQALTMANVPTWVWLILAIPALVVAVVMGVTYVSVVMMSRAAACLEPVAEPQMDIAREQAWAEGEGFVWVGAYLFKATATMKLAIWQHAEHAAYFCVYQHANGKNTDFVTILNPHISVTTGSTKDAMFLPTAPGSFAQAFAGLSLDEMFDRHLVAEQHVMDRLSMKVQPLHDAFEQVLVGAVSRQMAYIRSIPFWPIRAVHWYYIRRSRLTGLSVSEQEQRGLIDINKAAHLAAEVG